MLDASEIEALNSIVRTLDSLEPNAKVRVMLYLRGRLDAMGTLVAPAPLASGEKAEDRGAADKRKTVDIRKLRSEKSPRSDVEMVTVVAYYLQDEAPDDERKDTIDRSDLEKYFKQSRHPLPKRLGATLTNAKNAGYLDQVGQGEYRLNAVGYNLVAHSLPATAGVSRRTRGKRARAKPRSATKATQTSTGKPARKESAKSPSTGRKSESKPRKATSA